MIAPHPVRLLDHQHQVRLLLFCRTRLSTCENHTAKMALTFRNTCDPHREWLIQLLALAHLQTLSIPHRIELNQYRQLAVRGIPTGASLEARPRNTSSYG